MTSVLGSQARKALNGHSGLKHANVWSKTSLTASVDDVNAAEGPQDPTPSRRPDILDRHARAAGDGSSDFAPVALSTGHQLRLRRIEDTPDFYRLTMCAVHRLRRFEAWPHTYRFVGDEYRYVELLTKAWQQGLKIPLGIFDARGPVGALVAHIAEDRRSATISYWLAGHATGQGVATAAVTWLVEELFESWNVDRLEIHTLEHNTKSQAVAVRCGFTLETVKPYEFACAELSEKQLIYVRRR